MNDEMEASFTDVEKTIMEAIGDERIRFVALMVNDMARNTARMTSAGAIGEDVLDLIMRHTQSVMAIVMAAANLTPDELLTVRAQQPDPMVEILGFGPERTN